MRHIKAYIISALLCCLINRVGLGQTFTLLHTFSATNSPGPNAPGTNSDGAHPASGLILSDGTLVGTAYQGGTAGTGTIFALSTNGSSFTNYHSFSAESGSSFTNADGANPSASLLLAGDKLYGTCKMGGSGDFGCLFAINVDGTSFTNFCNFPVAQPFFAYPVADLTLNGNTLFGTDLGLNGESDSGQAFSVKVDGSSLQIVHFFSGAYPPYYTNIDGSEPKAGLTLISNKLYGTTYQGGPLDYGSIFSVDTNGSNFVTLINFNYTNGANPQAGLIFSNNALYGTTFYGGMTGGGFGRGTVFKVNLDGSGFTNLYVFKNVLTNGEFPDGEFPNSKLVLYSNVLYGTTIYGGFATNYGNGTVYAVNADGSGHAIIYSFSATSGAQKTNTDGAVPTGDLILSGQTLYGTTSGGGAHGNGTIFSITLGQSMQPQLGISLQGSNAILSWPASFVGFKLQSNANLGSPHGWGAVATLPVVINGTNIVTNTISTTQQFFRLSQ